ncbi:uncharacterized protein LOC143571004 [Bidens hawaiensis]|uniref:uncharacterized protein LOC143571004 n=1 Tax=Bidens hawaiensis TaxID=980011 RepID=UPI004049631E
MAVVLRYVDDVGEVIERFVGVVHVTDTCASSLKSAIDNFFAKNNLTMSKVRGQGYDGASNMRGELNGLKQKILAEKKCAFYIHCFAHQLQLVVVATSSEYASERFDSQKQHDDFVKRIETGEVCTGKVREVLIALSREGTDAKTRGITLGMAEKMENFEFVFIAHLMKYRDDGWEELMNEVTTFCSKNEINMPNMEDLIPGRVFDLLLNEMNERFTKANSELLTCIACLDPRDSFQTFDREKLLRLAELYLDDFSGFELGQLRIQLDRYISNMKSNEVFFGLHDIGELAKKMVQMKYHITYDLVYRLVELALVLPVATAIVERSFSAIKFIKTNLRNKMGDNFLTDALVCYVEKDIFANVENEAILQRFQAMGPRRCQLPAIGKKK